jgi:hypothetical protein
VRFASLYPRQSGFLAAFALRRWLADPRIVKTTDYGPRWRMHFIAVRSKTDLDSQLRRWLQESHDTVGLQDDLDRAPHPKRSRPAARERRRARGSEG